MQGVGGEEMNIVKKYISLFAALVLTAGIGLAAEIGSFSDPMYIGVGARPLGMGKAYVAVAQDGETLFLNPAGLGRLNGPKLTSMYSSLMGDVSYMALAGTYPLEVGSVGLGYVGSRVDNIWILGSDAVSADHYPTPAGLGGWSNNLLFLSYGFPLSAVTEHGKDLYFGANLKYFDKVNSGTSDATAADGRGVDLDLGVLYTPKGWLSLGLNQQNILPASLGGVVTYKSGIEESIPSITKAGVSVGVLGKADKALIESNMKLTLAADADLYPFDPKRQAGLHLGAEWWPIEALALRAGIDKDPVPATVSAAEATNLTAGVGLRLSGIAFDYAYHPYSSIKENATHYFSISYVGSDEEKKKEGYITMLKPRDKLITRRNYVTVSGIAHPSVDRIEVNKVPLAYDRRTSDRTFSQKIDLPVHGKNLLIIEAFDGKGNLLESHRRRILRLKTFGDVGEDHWARLPIEYCATGDLVEGYPDSSFRPERVLTRAELATILVRAKGESLIDYDPKVKLYPDVALGHWASVYIKTATARGLVVGYPDGTFKPSRIINRVEGVSVLSRFDGLNSPIPEYKPYSDVGLKHWAVGSIEAAKQKGLLDFITSDRLLLKRGLARSEAVEMLAKTDYGKERIDWLLDWERGYGPNSMANVKKPRQFFLRSENY